jgi:hypothetical protein
MFALRVVWIKSSVKKKFYMMRFSDFFVDIPALLSPETRKLAKMKGNYTNQNLTDV